MWLGYVRFDLLSYFYVGLDLVWYGYVSFHLCGYVTLVLFGVLRLFKV